MTQEQIQIDQVAGLQAILDSAGLGGSGPLLVQVRQTAAQSIPNSTFTQLTGWTELEDAHGAWALDQFVAPFAGIFLVTARVWWGAAPGSSSRWARLVKNGATIISPVNEQPVAAPNGGSNQLAAVVKLAAGDTLRLDVFQDSGVALATLASDPYYSSLEIAAIAETDPAASMSGIELLAVTSYGLPADASTTAFTYSKINAANLKLTFEAPASGKVMIRVFAFVTNSGGVNIGVGQTAAVEQGKVAVVGTSEAARPVELPFIISGLTPGQEYTYWAWFAVGQSGTAVIQDAGYGTCIMEVWTLQS